MDIYNKIQGIRSKTILTPIDHKELENIDKLLTQILVTADKQCIKKGQYPWSPKLHEAYLIHYYWSLKMSERKTKQTYPAAYLKIEVQVNPTKLQLVQNPTLLSKLRFTQKELRNIQKEAQAKRQAHLKELLQAASITQDKKKKKLILLLN